MKSNVTSLVSAIREHLLLPGETPTDLRRMYQALSPQDKEDLAGSFNHEFGYTIVPPRIIAANVPAPAETLLG